MCVCAHTCSSETLCRATALPHTPIVRHGHQANPKRGYEKPKRGRELYRSVMLNYSGAADKRERDIPERERERENAE